MGRPPKPLDRPLTEALAAPIQTTNLPINHHDELRIRYRYIVQGHEASQIARDYTGSLTKPQLDHLIERRGWARIRGALMQRDMTEGNEALMALFVDDWHALASATMEELKNLVHKGLTMARQADQPRDYLAAVKGLRECVDELRSISGYTRASRIADAKAMAEATKNAAGGLSPSVLDVTPSPDLNTTSMALREPDQGKDPQEC